MVFCLDPSILTEIEKTEKKMGISDIEFLEATDENFEKLKLAYENGDMTPEAEKYYLNLMENKEYIQTKVTDKIPESVKKTNKRRNVNTFKI